MHSLRAVSNCARSIVAPTRIARRAMATESHTTDEKIAETASQFQHRYLPLIYSAPAALDSLSPSANDAATVDAPAPPAAAPIPTPTPSATDSSASASASSASSLRADDRPGVSMTPRQVMAELDKHIVGQQEAKRAVAVALRNRYRRHRLPEALRAEVHPKNILMVGPTGVGKTEIARRLAKLCDAPFVKVEATKYTEVGFHGKDVDEMVKDLVDASIRLIKQRRRTQLRQQVAPRVEERLLDLLLGETTEKPTARADMLNYLRQGLMDNVQVKVPVPVAADDESGGMGGMGGMVVSSSAIPISVRAGSNMGAEIMKSIAAAARGGGLSMGSGSSSSRRTVDKHMPVSEARAVLTDIELDRAVGTEDVTREAIKLAEQDGIIVIDEIDKVCSPKGGRDGKDASAEGVQRDLLPLVEGSSVMTKYGAVDTTHVLFIACGAFSACKPSDMLAELQGRLPVKVELKALTQADLCRILTEPEHNLLRQQTALLATERCHVEFAECAVREIARVAADANAATDNIGARRLHAVIERLMDELSFEAPEREPDSRVRIDEAYVRQRVAAMIKTTDLSKYLL